MKILLDQELINPSYVYKNNIYNGQNEIIYSLDKKNVATLNEDIKYPIIKINEYEYNVIRFIELKGKSDYSIGDSIANIKEIVKKSEVGIGLNDHGQGFGLFAFNQECLSNNKKPILGCEFYLTTKYDHLVIIAKNKKGYDNLIKLITIGNSRVTVDNYENPKTRPYIDFSDFSNIDTEDLIILHGYDNSYINRSLEKKDFESAKKYLEQLNIIFGEDDVYLEVQEVNHQSDDINDELFRLSEEFNNKLVLTSDYHQINKEDDKILEIFQAIGSKEQVGDNNWKLEGDNYYIHSSLEIEERNLENDLLDNTIEIFNKIECYNLYQKENFLPIFNIPKGFKDAEDYFDFLIVQGTKARLGDNIPDEYQKRIEIEKETIKKMGFVGYFLIVADFINYGKRNYEYTDLETAKRWKNFLEKTGYPKSPIAFGPSRGSAGGSLISYLMAITEIDPLKYGLLFERFLNPERVSMPDIDTDIPDNKRQEIIHYIKDLYNTSDVPTESKVSGIGIFGTYKIKNAIKAIVRALYKDVTLGEKLTKYIEDPDLSVEEYIELPETQLLLTQDNRTEKVISALPKIFGLISNLSQHAAAYVIAPKSTTEFLPTTFVYNKKTEKMEQLTAYTYVEAVGLLKMDFLGLRSMTIIQETIDTINQRNQTNLTIDKILDKAITDINVYKHLQAGNTEDCFQLGSAGMTDVITKSLLDVNSSIGKEKALSGDFFSRLIACISMYRPGPLAYIPDFIENALNPEHIHYEFEELKPILEKSYGLLIYQESIMQILQEVAGFSLGQADIARRAISKKKIEDLKKLKSSFIYGDENIQGGIKKLNLTEGILEKLWSDIESFASYGFNKSHAAGYAHVTIITAFLAYHYPLEFAVSNLNHPSGNQDDAIGYLLNIYKKRQLKIKPASINLSKDRFSVKDDYILFGFEGIKGLASYSRAIYQERSKGPFKDLQDFLIRMSRDSEKSITRGVVTSLIFSGAIDEFIGTRKDKFDAIEKISDILSLFKKETNTVFEKETDLLGNYLDFKGDYFSKIETLLKEKEYTGFFISGHPVDDYDYLTKDLNYYEISDIKDLSDGTIVEILGIVNKTRKITTKNNDLMMFANLSDKTGSIDTVIFPTVYTLFSNSVKKNKILVLSGTVENGKIIVQTVRDVEDIVFSTKIDHVQLLLSEDKQIAKQQIENVLMSITNLTKDSVKLSYVFNQQEIFSSKRLGDFYIDINNTNIKNIKEIIGSKNVKFIWKTTLVKKDN